MLSVNSRSSPASRTLNVYSRTSGLASNPKYLTKTSLLIWNLRSLEPKGCQRRTVPSAFPLLPSGLEDFLVLLPRRFEVVRLLLLTRGLSLRTFQLLQLHALRNGQLRFRIDSIRVNNKLEGVRERRTDKLDGIPGVSPRGNVLRTHVVPIVRRGIDGQSNAGDGAVFRGDSLHHIRRGESFGGGSIVGYGHLIELAVIEREHDLTHGVELRGCSRRVWRPPGHLLNQRRLRMDQLYIGGLLVRDLEEGRQAGSEGKGSIPGKILGEKHRGGKEQGDKAKNGVACRFHVHVSAEFRGTGNRAVNMKTTRNSILCLI